jgi:hypothetical protein
MKLATGKLSMLSLCYGEVLREVLVKFNIDQ